ncbi:MAG: 3-dehydroquinate dehydratase-2 [Saprospiraceae bacterium]
MKQILIINGPNLNLLGKREPEIYGNLSFEEYFKVLVDRYSEMATLSYYQSNHEGNLIDKLQEVGFGIDGIILNAGGYTHTSIALADCVSAIVSQVIEVHISDITKREPFRKHSYLEPVCTTSIMGHGLKGYDMAIDFLIK